MPFRLFTLLAVLALAVGTWILSSPARHPGRPADAKESELPGYYLKNAVLTDFDVAGNPGLRIEAERIDQVGRGSEIALHNVRVAYKAPEGQIWTMVGDEARVEPGGKVVNVAGNVRLQGDPNGTGNDDAVAVVRTDRLRYDVTNAVASTDSDVRLDYQKHTLTAHGLIANLKERKLSLESKVNGHFHP